MRRPFSTKHFTWLHVPKTGGTWLHDVFTRYAPVSWEAIKGKPAHVMLWELPVAMEQWLERPERLALPVLAGVRNPWDWYVSLYFFMEGHYRNRTGGFLPKQSQWDSGLKLWASTYSRGHTLDAFRSVLPMILDHMHLQRRFGIARPQYEFLRLGTGQLGVTPVRYEGLRKNMLAALESLGVEIPPNLRDGLTQLPPQNASTHPPYAECYTPELRDLVAKHERWLIETMGYEF